MMHVKPRGGRYSSTAPSPRQGYRGSSLRNVSLVLLLEIRFAGVYCFPASRRRSWITEFRPVFSPGDARYGRQCGANRGGQGTGDVKGEKFMYGVWCRSPSRGRGRDLIDQMSRFVNTPRQLPSRRADQPGRSNGRRDEKRRTRTTEPGSGGARPGTNKRNVFGERVCYGRSGG
jgi:hypothetical protein